MLETRRLSTYKIGDIAWHIEQEAVFISVQQHSTQETLRHVSPETCLNDFMTLLLQNTVIMSSYISIYNVIGLVI